MAFVYCPSCNWCQDDFWSKSYNPLRHLVEWWEDRLLDFDNLDKQFTDYGLFIKERGNLTTREVIAQDCERAAKKIRNMVFLREEDCIDAICPRCGSALAFN